MTTTNPQEEPNEAYFKMREELQMNVAQNNAAVNHKLYLVLMLVTGLAAIVALIVSLVVFSSQGATTCVIGGSNSGLVGTGGAGDTKVWNIAVGHMANNKGYIDPVTRQIKGFYVDIVNEVCKIGNKNCRLVWDLYNRCWDSQAGEIPRGGQGLLAGWYDGCAGWVQTYDRVRTFQFSKAFSKLGNTYLVIKNNNPRGVSPTDLTDKIVGFVDGYASDEYCLRRQDVMGNQLTKNQIKHYVTPQDLFDAVVAGEVDAGFLAAASEAPDTVTVFTDNPFTCSIGGDSVMTRKDNGLVDWWNPALDNLLQSSSYQQICKDLNEAHGVVPGKDPSDVCFGM